MISVFSLSDSTLPDPLGGANLEQCVGLLQKPGCGTEPVLSGDRGGTMQVVTFVVLIVALAVIAVRIARSVSNRDKAKNVAPGDDTSADTTARD
jgi:hypothetical protein